MSADGARKLFVGGLADSATEAELRAIFESGGYQVESLALPRDRESGRLRGFAFITLSTEEDAERARSELQGVDFCGRPLSIRAFSQESPARGNSERPPRQEEPTVFLGKLPFDATQQEIQDLFAEGGVGPVTRVILPLGPDGRPRGFGFATLPDAEQVNLAVEKMNGATLGGRQIVVSPAQARGAGGGGGGGTRGGPGGFSGGHRSDAPSQSGGGGYGAPRGPRSSFSGGDRERPPWGGGGGAPPSPSGGYGRPSNSFSSDSGDSPPRFPPSEARGGSAGGSAGAGGRRRNDGKRKERDRRGGDSAPQAAGGARGARKKRGGGGSWHQWESDDD